MKTTVMLFAFALSGICLSLGVGYNAQAVELEQTVLVADGLLMPDYWVNIKR